MNDWWKKTKHFLWEEDSVASWVANIIIAYLLIQFIIYPVLGSVMGTAYPVVAVVSSSMEHPGGEQWFDSQASIYSTYSISKEDFNTYPFRNGFNKGDIIILQGVTAKEIGLGEVIVFTTNRPEPVIHRVVDIHEIQGEKRFKTKGDNNRASLPQELSINESRIIGKGILRVPYLGWVKLLFVESIKYLK